MQEKQKSNPSTSFFPRVLVVVSGGVADPVWDAGVDVEVFDWDNYKDDPVNTSKVPAHFADLAVGLSIPVETSDAGPSNGAQSRHASDISAVKEFESVESAKLAVEAGLAYLRANSVEPVSIRYTDQIDIEISPTAHDDRVLVGSQGRGSTTVNYTEDGLILDVYCGDPAILEPISTQIFYPDDLTDNEISGAWDRSAAESASASAQRDGRG